MGGILHDIQAVGYGLARLGVAVLIVQLGAADNIGEQDCNFQVFCHSGLSRLCKALVQLFAGPVPGAPLDRQLPDR
jgi:hypothetical protein